MKPYRLLFLCLALSAVPQLLAASPSPVPAPKPASPITLRKGFAQPPESAKLRCYWWWLNGNTTEETITNDLTEMKRKGFGGVLLVDGNGSNQQGNENAPAGPLFGSPQWVKLYLHALKTAAALHMEVTLNMTSGWNLGGPDTTPAQASKLLTWSRTAVTGDAFDGTLAMPETKNGFYRQIAVLAYPLRHGISLPGEGADARSPISDLPKKSAAIETGFSMSPSEPLLEDNSAVAGEEDASLKEVINLSADVDSNGHLRWTPPSKGAWEILRIGYTDSDVRTSTSSGAWQGLAIDYLDRDAFDTFWSHTVAPLLEVARPYLKTTLVNLATDSWEVGGTNWTGRFASEFRQRRGYDPVPYLPVLTGRIVQDRSTSNRFLNDMRRTVGDLLTDHYDHFAERAKAYGLGTQAESGGPHGAPIDALETFRSSAVPQTEYWAQSDEHRSLDKDRFFTKEAASAADIYGKQMVAQEGMTSMGPQWSESLAADLKPSFDEALTEGMNRLVWHEFTSSPASFGLPGNEYFAGTHLNPKITWWQQGTAFFLYLNRSQFMMQQGHAVDDALYFYGDQVPNFARLKDDDPARVLPGYDYDVTNEDALLHSLTIRAGAIYSPAGNRYRMVVMPKSRRLSLAALERIAAYAKQGGTVVGPTPLSPTGNVSAEKAQRFAELAHELWGECAKTPHAYGAGRVYCTTDARAVLTQLQLKPDFAEDSGKLDYAHRRDGSTDIYFVRNGTSNQIDTLAGFRVIGRTPEFWNAVDGSIAAQASYRIEDGVTRVPLHLAPYQSLFVVFKQASGAQLSDGKKATESVEEAKVKLPANQWTIAFQADRGAPQEPRKLDAFTSWTESTEPGIRYFSGTATYSTSVNIEKHPGKRVLLKLAELHEICTVRINGKPAGTIWAMPLELDITDSLKSGENSIQIDVTNLWPNRIIGDAQPSNAHAYTNTNIRKYTKDSPLLPSGLIGAVTLETIPDATAQVHH